MDLWNYDMNVDSLVFPSNWIPRSNKENHKELIASVWNQGNITVLYWEAQDYLDISFE